MVVVSGWSIELPLSWKVVQHTREHKASKTQEEKKHVQRKNALMTRKTNYSTELHTRFVKK